MALPRTSLEQWAVLAAVVDRGGFAQAAAMLHRSQSAVSYAIARLQAALPAPLLRIEGRKAVLTANGAVLLKRARPLLRELETLEALALSIEKGWEPELRLVVDSAFPRARLVAILGELQRRCPRTQLQLSDAVLSGAEDAITAGAADVVVTPRVPAGSLGDWLADVTFVAVARADHPLNRTGTVLTAADLTQHAQAVVRDSGRHPRDEGWLEAEYRCTVSSVEASLAIVEAGLAFAWLPQDLVRAPLQEGALRSLPLASGATRKMPLYLVLVRPALAGPAAHAAVECFQRHSPAGSDEPSRAAANPAVSAR